jgi:type II secretory pathway pseudopilin PulG
MKPVSLFPRRRRPGFMLISMMSTLTIAGVLLSVTAPAIMGTIENRDLEEERVACEELANELRMSWSIPYPDYNVALFPGAPGVAGERKFNKYGDLKEKKWKKSDETKNDPMIKLARRRDRAPNDGEELDGKGRGGKSDLWFNKRRAKRVILVDPTNEENRQRYLVVSLMTPSHLELTLPTPDNTVTDNQLFEKFWNKNWDDPGAQIPDNWNVSTDQKNLWNEMNRGRTNASRLVVVRVVQSKYILMVNNGFGSNSNQKLWVELPALSVNNPNNPVFIDERGNNGIIQTTPFSTEGLPVGSPFKFGIPEGTLVNIWRGTTTANRQIVRRFFMDGNNTSITVN